jgi:ubiquitin carboxyl-terminal hydrolase 25/28
VFDATRALLMSIQETPDDVDSVDVSPSVLTTLESLAAETRKELVEIETKCKELSTNISSQFADLRRIPYRLHSAFFHRGTVSFGHYWIYIYDFGRDKWRRYNDGYVTEVTDRKDIFEQEQNNPATPYFVVYVADDQKDALVEPVCREINVPEILSAQEDVEMENLPTEVDEIAGTTYSGTASSYPTDVTQPRPAMIRPEGAWDASSAF